MHIIYNEKLIQHTRSKFIKSIQTAIVSNIWVSVFFKNKYDI